MTGHRSTVALVSIHLLVFSALLASPSYVQADPEDAFYPLEPVVTSFGDPGVFKIDASANHALIEAPAAMPEFADTEAFIAHMEATFNAVRKEVNGVAVGFDLEVLVRGQPIATDGDEFFPLESPVVHMLAGPDGRLRIGNSYVCMISSCAGPEDEVLHDRYAFVIEPPPVYYVEGQLSATYLHQADCSQLGSPCSSSNVEVATIEHDSSYFPVERAWCHTPGGIRYPCIRYNERDNILSAEATVVIDYGIVGTSRDVYYHFEEDVERFSFYVMAWEMTAYPPRVEIEGIHEGRNFDRVKFDRDESSLTLGP